MSLLTADYSHCALLIIDFQKDFVLPGSPAEIAGSFAVLPKLAQLTRTIRQQGRPIVHVVRCYLPDGSNVDLCRREQVQSDAAMVLPCSEGAMMPLQLQPEVMPELDWDALLKGIPQQIGPQEWVLYKSRWGAFYQTRLEDLLHRLQVNTLLFGGCNFPNCPRTTIYEASERDFRLVLAQDAMSGLYEKGLQELSGIGVTVATTEQICRELAP